MSKEFLEIGLWNKNNHDFFNFVLFFSVLHEFSIRKIKFLHFNDQIVQIDLSHFYATFNCLTERNIASLKRPKLCPAYFAIFSILSEALLKIATKATSPMSKWSWWALFRCNLALASSSILDWTTISTFLLKYKSLNILKIILLHHF